MLFLIVAEISHFDAEPRKDNQESSVNPVNFKFLHHCKLFPIIDGSRFVFLCDFYVSNLSTSVTCCKYGNS